MTTVCFIYSFDGQLLSPLFLLFSLNYHEVERWEKRSYFPGSHFLSVGLDSNKGPKVLFSLGEQGQDSPMSPPP